MYRDIQLYFSFVFYKIPNLEFCGDNAAMIAMRGLQVYNSGKRFSLKENAFPSLPNDLFLPYQEN